MHERTASRFRRFAEVEAVGNQSPLYAKLASWVATDTELLELAEACRDGQPAPNMLFAAAQLLLGRHQNEELAAYYPSMGGARPADDGAAPAFHEFCVRHRDEIVPILRERMVQTNEVRRSALLLPAFADIATEAGSPLSLVEIGPSAGLNLLFDRYAYDYGDGLRAGAGSAVVLECESRGAPPPLVLPRVASRAGIDINPLDVTSPGDVEWLRALVWPEHDDRRALLDAAINVAAKEPPRLIGGDVFELLPEEAAAAPDGSALCVVATFVLNQFSRPDLARFRSMLEALSCRRPVWLVVIGLTEFVLQGEHDGQAIRVWTLRIDGGKGLYRLSSLCNPHGRWIEYQPNEPYVEWLPWDETGNA